MNLNDEDRGWAAAALSMTVLAVVLVITLFVALGCAAPTAPTAPRMFVLRTVNGSTLPAPGLFGTSLEAGAISLNPDATYMDVLRISGTLDTLVGTWDQVGDTVRFFPERTATVAYFGLLSDAGATLRVWWAEGAFGYVRR